MKIKKLLSLVMAVVMTVALAIPAFAEENKEEEETATNTQTVISGTYEEIPIAVVVPETGEAVINPYGLAVKVSDGGDKTYNLVGQQITTKPLFVKNQGAMDLSVGASVVATIPTTSGVKFSEDPIEADATGKSVRAYLQMAPTVATGDEDTASPKVIKEFSEWKSDYNDKKDVLVGTRATTGEDIVTLVGAKVDKDSGEFTSYNAGSIGMFRLAGEVVTAPKGGWAETDTFEVTIAFTFAPVAATPAA